MEQALQGIGKNVDNPKMSHENVKKVMHFFDIINLVAKNLNRMSSERPDYLTGVACGYGTDKLKSRNGFKFFLMIYSKIAFSFRNLKGLFES